MNKNYYAILMAGGVGSRFWPVSTTAYPKQFHDMIGSGQTLIQKTFQRLSSFVPRENILILTNERYNDITLKQLPQIGARQVILEPAMRNTAPCILYAALKIQKENPNATMIVAPSDHWIEDEEAFASDVEKCFKKSQEEDVLCTLGIKPSFPNTGFGYIEYFKDDEAPMKKVVQFREKPDYATAKQFLDQGNFLWNAGIFIWSAKTIVKAFQEFQPGQFALFQKGMDIYNTEDERAFIEENYPRAENISIDYAILEKSDAIYVLPASFDWNDLGTWGALYDKLKDADEENVLVDGEMFAENSSGNMVKLPEGKLAVIEGLQDYIIVDKEEVLMILPRSKEQKIKEILARVKKRFGEHYG
ncbi:MAG: mannose-1-phosphate guanylyltransferase [Eudoraea sp.]|nr:mannose-1-phosphate guanylyltransferase [Eudoraea sp.]